MSNKRTSNIHCKKLGIGTGVALLLGLIVVIAIVALGVYMFFQVDDQGVVVENSLPDGTQVIELPEIGLELTITEIASGLDRPWDIGYISAGRFIFTERSGEIKLLEQGNVSVIAEIDDIYARGEGGLMGIAIDPEFEQNNHVYACFNSTKGDEGEPDIRIARWRMSASNYELSEREDILTGITSNASGRHSGCQLGFGPDGYLWVGTGDAAIGSIPQDPTELGGKILRIDREGAPASTGNLGGEFDPRIYSYGHRNTQGLAFFDPESNPFGIIGINVEHGPLVDDQLNPLLPGNFGWNPVPGYNESVAMTDTDLYPNAIPSIWDSGRPTLATSGGTIIAGDNSEKWGDWQNAILMAGQRSERIRAIEIDPDLNISRETDFLTSYGRIRTVQYFPDGHLYALTDNGRGGDLILRLEIA